MSHLKGNPQVKDLDEVFPEIRKTKTGFHTARKTKLTAICIRKKTIERTNQAKQPANTD